MQYSIKNIDLSFIASVYGGCAYGESEYGTGTCNETTTTENTAVVNTNDNILSDTGYNVIVPVALGIAIVIASIVLLVKKVLRKKQF